MEEPTTPPNISTPPTPNQTVHSISPMMWTLMIGGLVVGIILLALAWVYLTRPTVTPATTVTSTNSGTVSTTIAVCAQSDLNLSLGSTEGTAGTIYQRLILTNKNSKSCTISGYPAVFLIDGSGNVLGSGAIPTSASPATTITLTPGSKAHVSVGFPQAANFSAGTCTASSAAVRVYLPGTASFLDTSLAKPYCPGFSTTAFVSGE